MLAPKIEAAVKEQWLGVAPEQSVNSPETGIEGLRQRLADAVVFETAAPKNGPEPRDYNISGDIEKATQAAYDAFNALSSTAKEEVVSKAWADAMKVNNRVDELTTNIAPNAGPVKSKSATRS
jgi:hypothetical protein